MRIRRTQKTNQPSLWRDKLTSAQATRSTPDAGAILSGCGTFRYVLTRFWDYSKPILTPIMLNPSTGDAYEEDQTIRKTIGFAKLLGYGGLTILNLWSYRTKNSQELRRAHYPIGPSNDFWIEAMLGQADEVICAWGENAFNEIGFKRIKYIESVLARHRITPKAFKTNTSGAPSHPLMLPYNAPLVDYVPLSPVKSYGGKSKANPVG